MGSFWGLPSSPSPHLHLELLLAEPAQLVLLRGDLGLGLGDWSSGPGVWGGLQAWSRVWVLQTLKHEVLKLTIQPFSCEVKQQTVVLDVLQNNRRGFSVRVPGLSAWEIEF